MVWIESRRARRDDCHFGRVLSIAKKSVGGGAAGGRLGSGIFIGYWMRQTIAIEGECLTETGMVPVGSEVTPTDLLGNLWAYLVREAARVDLYR